MPVRAARRGAAGGVSALFAPSYPFGGRSRALIISSR